jgi:flavin-dependent dehydrogenase
MFDASHPREKPCGGGVTGRALALASDVTSGLRDAAVHIRTARFGAAAVPLPDGALFVASRQAFDGALVDAAQRAGATLVRERVLDVDVAGDRASVRTATGVHHAAAVIGADGANSLVRRRVATAFRREQLSIATGVYARDVTSDEIVIEFVDDPPGYIWSFPRPDHLAIGICAQADAGATSSALGARVDAWMRRTHLARGASLQPYSWPIPSLRASDFRAPVSGPRWLLAGDAAGFVDPITREGIFFSLQSGEAAAAALLTNDPASTYEARVRAEIVPELVHAAQLKAGFFRPPFVRLLLRALERSEPIRRVMADLVSGRQSYGTLKWRLLRTLEVRLAWEALRTRAATADVNRP